MSSPTTSSPPAGRTEARGCSGCAWCRTGSARAGAAGAAGAADTLGRRRKAPVTVLNRLGRASGVGWANAVAATARGCSANRLALALTGLRQYGIYELSGNRLTLCFAAPGQTRPGEFGSAPGDGRTFTVWALVKR